MSLARSPYDAALVDAGRVPPGSPSSPGRVSAIAGTRACMPTRDQLTYTRELLLVVLLLVAFPWLLANLVKRPAKVLSGAGVKAGL